MTVYYRTLFCLHTVMYVFIINKNKTKIEKCYGYKGLSSGYFNIHAHKKDGF